MDKLCARAKVLSMIKSELITGLSICFRTKAEAGDHAWPQSRCDPRNWTWRKSALFAIPSHPLEGSHHCSQIQ